MSCVHCGCNYPAHFKFCPQCGAPTSSAESPAGPTPPKRKMPLWLKGLLALCVLALLAVTAGIMFTENLVDVVEHQLSSLAQGRTDDAYFSFTAREFQKATPVKQFQAFVQAHPIFSENPTAHFAERSLKDRVAVLRGHLTNQARQQIQVEYKLIKEDGSWKILSVRLLPQKSTGPKKEKEAYAELISTVKHQLHSLHQGDLKKGYSDYFAKEFQQETSLESFAEFVDHYPILKEYHTLSLHKPIIKNDVGSVAAILQSDQTAAYIKYYFVREGNQWRILSMRILATPEEENAPPDANPEKHG